MELDGTAMGLISAAAVQAFLNRSLDNHDWIKRQQAASINDAIAGMSPLPNWGRTQPWLHQKALFLLMQYQQRFMIYTDLGGGKTLTVLHCLRYRKQCGEKPRAIIFAPYVVSTETWVEQVALHAPGLECVALTGTIKQNKAKLAGSGDLFVICYQSAVAMCSVRIPSQRVILNGEESIRKAHWKLDNDLIDNLFAGVDMIVCDEIHRVKTVQSLTYALCKKLSKKCHWAFGLTGTPFGNDLLDLWPQFYVIDSGETLGKALGVYRSAFFNTKATRWGVKYPFKKRMMPQLHAMVKHRSLRYKIEDLHDMPQRKYNRVVINAPNEAKGYIAASLQQIKDASRAKGKGQAHYELINSNYMRLRQLSSGFLTLRGADDERVQLQFKDNPKLDAFAELAEGMPSDAKMVVFHHFRFSNGLLSRKLTDMKIGHARIWGGQSKPIVELQRFATDPNCRVLVINSRSGSSSLNLQHANYVVFFEQPDSPIDRQQAERRVWRPGQLKRVFYYDLIVDGTVDQRLHLANKSGQNLLRMLLDGKITL